MQPIFDKLHVDSHILFYGNLTNTKMRFRKK